MIPLNEARQIISGKVARKGPATVALGEARGGVLSDAVRADADYPAVDRSTMDGYALRADETSGDLSVVGEIRAGSVWEKPIAPGEALRVFTGAALPPAAGRVVPQEQVRRSGDRIEIVQPEPSHFIRRKGEEARAGEVILAAGTRLGAAELSVLAQLGVVTPQVIAAPMITHLVTGDEIVPPSASPGPGQIRDSNSALIAALASDFGLEIAQAGHAPDDLAAIVSFLHEPADLILLSGGASVGDYDLGARALEQAGFAVHFRQVNLRPGKPLTFATRGDTAAFVLPGNPVAHFVCWHVAVKLALERFLGLAPRWEFLDLEVFDGQLPRPDPRQVFWPAKVVIRDGRPGVIPKPWSTSGNTFVLPDTNALVRIDGTRANEGTIPTLLVGKYDLF